MSSKILPQLAKDVILDKLVYPVIVMPKIDGVRCVNIDGAATGRSLKPFENQAVSSKFSENWMKGLDGELAYGNETDPELCSVTSGFCGRKECSQDEIALLNWHVFDYISESTVNVPYIERLKALMLFVAAIGNKSVFCVPWQLAHSEQELLQWEAEWLSRGYEGVIVRNPNGMYKSGRSSVKEAQYLRLKRFVDFEGEVVEVVEAQANGNEAKATPLGTTERSSAKAGKTPKGVVGSFVVRVLSDVVDPVAGQVLLSSGSTVSVGAGKLTAAERKDIFQNKAQYVGKILKAKMFPKGVKTLPRFPTFISFRLKEDM